VRFNYYYEKMIEFIKTQHTSGCITQYYAPADTNNILPGERVFYSTENAVIIDTAIKFIEENIPEDIQPLFIGPLLYEASTKSNSCGHFNAFLKDKNTGIGKMGGTLGAKTKAFETISIQKPILSEHSCNSEVYCSDANKLAHTINKHFDLVYLDPPYNELDYSSRYFMLNSIVNNEVNAQHISAMYLVFPM